MSPPAPKPPQAHNNEKNGSIAQPLSESTWRNTILSSPANVPFPNLTFGLERQLLFPVIWITVNLADVVQ